MGVHFEPPGGARDFPMIGRFFLSATLAVLAAPALACGPDALGVARELPVGGGVAVGLKTYPRTLALADKELVLTFDDGPNPPTTAKVLDALKAECVKATFFLIGKNAESAPAMVKREIAEGHTIAHHSYSHPAVTLRNLPLEAAKADVDRGMEQDDKAAFGAWSGQTRSPFFRYPGFGDSPALNDWLQKRGVSLFGADLWASDWLPMSADQELKLLLARIQKQRKGIVLMHDIKKNTAEMLPRLLRELKKRGYKIVHIVPGPAAPALASAPAGWFSETERALAHTWPKAPPGMGAAAAGKAKAAPGPL
ncbi:MAG: polysaccharide deacetylase family protein [Hyphomicrobiales bacterium]|nr:polysaccharide deacetylase family protein [Hyphomicrobiales bacterium]